MRQADRCKLSICQEALPGSNYSDDEREFIVAIERYKRENRRPFPAWHEVLAVLKSLGYRKKGL